MALLGMAMSVPAQGEVRTLMTAGLWSAYAASADDQRAACGISTTGPDGRRLAIEQSSGDTGLDVILDKTSWAIPDNTAIEIVVQVDNGAGVPLHATGSGTRVLAHMAFDASVGFMQGIRHGRQVRIFFPSGNEPPWTGGLQGSSAAINGFNDCRGNFPPASATQPFRPEATPTPASPTQPFGSAPPPRT